MAAALRVLSFPASTSTTAVLETDAATGATATRVQAATPLRVEARACGGEGRAVVQARGAISTKNGVVAVASQRSHPDFFGKREVPRS